MAIVEFLMTNVADSTTTFRNRWLSLLPVLLMVTCAVLLDYALRKDDITMLQRSQCQVWLWLIVALSWMQLDHDDDDDDGSIAAAGAGYSVVLAWSNMTIFLNLLAICAESVHKNGSRPLMKDRNASSSTLPEILQLTAISSWIAMMYTAIRMCSTVGWGGNQTEASTGGLSFFVPVLSMLILIRWHVKRQERIQKETLGLSLAISTATTTESQMETTTHLGRFCGPACCVPNSSALSAASSTMVPVMDESQWFTWDRKQTLQWMSRQLHTQSNPQREEACEDVEKIVSKLESQRIIGDVLDGLADVTKLMLLRIPFGPACRLSGAIERLIHQFPKPSIASDLQDLTTLTTGPSWLSQHDRQYNSAGMRLQEIPYAATSQDYGNEAAHQRPVMLETCQLNDETQNITKAEEDRLNRLMMERFGLELPKIRSKTSAVDGGSTNSTPTVRFAKDPCLTESGEGKGTKTNPPSSFPSTAMREQRDVPIPQHVWDDMPPHIQEIAERRPDLVVQLLQQKQQSQEASTPLQSGGTNNTKFMARKATIASHEQSDEESNVTEDAGEIDDDETTSLIPRDFNDSPVHYRSLEKSITGGKADGDRRRMSRPEIANGDLAKRSSSSRHPPLTNHVLLLSLVFISLGCVCAWAPTNLVYGKRAGAALQQRPISSKSSLLATPDSQDDDDGEGISDLDARVLRSLLQDSKKLDLQQEENMRQLLERGVKSKEKVELPKKQEEVESEYSSKVFQTLTDTKLWKALSRNWQDAVESAQIALQNRIERDAKLVASLGIFALDRALQDVSRALPAAASAINKQRNKVLQLSDKSSFQETKLTDKVDLRKEFSTPQDEIKSVSAEIKQIFQQADAQVTPRSLSSSRAASAQQLISSATSLKSTARRGTARLSQAYQRQQKTKLAREKENIAQTGTRFASRAIDSAYQVKRELQIEPNQPGYKTKRLRQATASTARLLASAAKAGASTFLLGTNGKKKSDKQLPQTSSSASARTSANPTKFPPSFVDATFVDANVIDKTDATRDTGMEATAAAMDAANFFYATRKAAVGTSTPPSKPAKSKTYSVTADPVDFLDNQPYFAFKRAGAPSQEGNAKTISQLLEQDDEADIVAKYVDVMKDNQPARASTSLPTPPIQDIITAEVMTDTLDDMIGEAMQDIDSVIIDGNNNKYFYTGSEYVELEEEQENYLVVDSLDENLRQVTAEVISEEDFENVFGQAKAVDILGDEFDDEMQEGGSKEPNLLTKVTLRSLDVLFLVVEKTVLLIPDILVVTNRVSTRLSEVSREGLGQVGWQQLNTKIRGSKRY
jgi:hypothetical protein